MIRAAALVVLGLALVSARAQAAEVDLGILEQLSPAQTMRLEKAYGQKPEAVVRVAFRGAGGAWSAFPGDITAIGQFPAKVAWTVAFDGQARGRLESASPPQWLAYADLGLQFLLPGSTPPRIGAPAAAFEQWDSDTPVRRPLVLVSARMSRTPSIGSRRRPMRLCCNAGRIASAPGWLRRISLSRLTKRAFS